ncbi:MAG: hypothetical protein U0556_05040 [Dehalococcoidia bacterium]
MQYVMRFDYERERWERTPIQARFLKLGRNGRSAFPIRPDYTVTYQTGPIPALESVGLNRIEQNTVASFDLLQARDLRPDAFAVIGVFDYLITVEPDLNQIIAAGISPALQGTDPGRGVQRPGPQDQPALPDRRRTTDPRQADDAGGGHADR